MEKIVKSLEEVWREGCVLSKVNPLATIDFLLQNFKDCNTTDLREEKWLNLYCQCIIYYVTKNQSSHYDFEGEPTSLIFNRSIIQNPRFVAVSFLRLLNNAPNFFKAGEFRNKAFNLFDEQLGKDVYSRRNISVKDQTFKKEQELRDLVQQVENDMSNLTASLSQIRGLSAFQESFMRRLNQPDPKSILRPFIPSPLWDQRIQECFSAAIAYRDSDYSKALHNYHSASEIFQSYLREAKESGSHYATQYLGGAVESLSRVVCEHIKASPISKPANLSISIKDKKYPLHVKDKCFEIAFTIVNDGPGVGYEAQVEFSEGFGVSADFSTRRAHLGTLEPGVKQQALLSVIGQGSENEAFVEVKLKWSSFDGTFHEIKDTFEIRDQRWDIDWDVLAATEAYSLDPVESEAELVGRKDILDKLTARARSRTMGSSYISGQKRVGKTSIVNALTDRLKQESEKIAFVYVLSGDVNSGEAEGTIGNLASKLCRQVQLQDERLRNVYIPRDSKELTSVANFIDEVKIVASDLKIHLYS